jgi:GNAT superfamily N-acetyltransferase
MKHQCNLFNFELLSQYRRKRVGTKLLETVLEFAMKYDTSLIIIQTSEEDGKQFAKRIGAQEASVEGENRLDMTKLNWDMLNDWAKEGPLRSPDSKLEFFEDCPEDIIEDYCLIYTEVMNQAPRDELEVGDMIETPERRRMAEKHNKTNNRPWLTAITREPNGDISGLTEVFYIPSMDPLIFQDLTGVQEKYRGSGKGKWLKAIMLLEVKKRFSTVNTVVTMNATTNAPMLSINDRLGFKLHKEISAIQMKTEDLEQYLKK